MRLPPVHHEEETLGFGSGKPTKPNGTGVFFTRAQKQKPEEVERQHMRMDHFSFSQNLFIIISSCRI